MSSIVQQHVLEQVPSEWTVHRAAFVARGRRVVYAASAAGRHFVVSGGRRWGDWDGVEELAAHLEHERWACVARRGRQRAVLVDGEETGTFDWVGSLSVTALGSVVHLARRGSAYVLVRDGIAAAAFDEISPPALSADGSVEAYAARSGQRWQVVHGGNVGPTFDRVTAPALSRDGLRIAYCARRGATWAALVGSRELPRRFDEALAPAIASEGERLAFWGLLGERWYVSDGDWIGPAFERWAQPKPSVSRTGAHVACAGARGEHACVNLDGRDGEHVFEAVGQPVFAADERLAYLACRAGRGFLSLAGRLIAEFDALVPDAPVDPADYDRVPFLAERASAVAYTAAHAGRQRVVIDGHPGPAFAFVDSPVFFAPDGVGVAYTAIDRRQAFLVVDDEVSPGQDRIWLPAQGPDGQAMPAFSAAGQVGRVAVGARSGAELRWLVAAPAPHAPPVGDA